MRFLGWLVRRLAVAVGAAVVWVETFGYRHSCMGRVEGYVVRFDHRYVW